jgi:hypothetical protein
MMMIIYDEAMNFAKQQQGQRRLQPLVM